MGVKALLPDLKLFDAQERDIDPDFDLIRVNRLIELAGGTIVCVLSSCPAGSDTLVFTVDRQKGFQPITGLKEVDKLWPAGDELLALIDEAILKIGLDGEQRRLLELPEEAKSLDASWTDDGVRIAAIIRGERREGPGLYPADRDCDTLQAYSPQTGWRKVAEIPSGCRSLSLSDDGSRCAWLEPLNTVPEEAMRGEFRTCDLETGAVVELTSGAGQAQSIAVAPDGSGTIYRANFQKKRPITTHTDLWWHPWGRDKAKNLTGGGRCIDDFGWLDSKTIWVSFIDGVSRTTEEVTLDGRKEELEHPATSEVIGRYAYESSGGERYPFLNVDSKAVEIPQPEIYDDLQLKVVDWKASDGLAIRGVLLESKDTPEVAPLLVRAHGGPAGDVEATRGEAVRHRHLLRSGYRVFIPAFRGSLGFGDDFLGANIGCQGVKDLDDILTGVDRLVELGIADADRVGIFGGSYGGYMALRGVAVTDRFKTGVALYGFIDNRRMTLETGDFTYEEEYIAPVTWPMQEDVAKSDVFSHLHEISCPLLMMHGDQDPICTLSQSKIVYRALEHRGIKTGLVVYPREGHGFRKPEHRQDCARRTLAWFEEFLPV